MIRIEQSRSYRKYIGDYSDDYVSSLESAFEEYGLKLVPFQSFDHDDLEREFEDPFVGWFTLQEDMFFQYWEKITDEVFHLLFANRGILLRFGKSLAEYLSLCAASLPDDILSNTGRIKRVSYIPSWLKKAVFYRDHGRCVSCRKDLSGLVTTDQRINFDHIVPLANWGTNDPSNFQLMCEKCNLRKSDSQGWAGMQYIAWWDY